jgi:predicted RNase H-like nuclease (RuvC/YqgF family)
MSKYDKMVQINKRKNEEKVQKAVQEIRRMVLEGEKVSIPRLMEYTGFSRGFFYKNPVVRQEIDQALEQQVGLSDPRREILNQALQGKIELLEKQVRMLKREKESLQAENEKLKKALSRKEMDILKKL